jgi:hypothetical protein
MFSFILLQIKAQEVIKDTVTRAAFIKYDKNGNEVSFKPKTPTLNQIAGAPPAFYTYLWEFGDGDYSQQEQPKHTYNKGTYTARLEVTNNYDDGKPPKTRPDDLSFNEEKTIINNENHQLFVAYGGARLLTNRDPIPSQEMNFIFSYGNDKDYVTNGKLYLFYNEKAFKNKNFTLKETRTYFNEKELDNQDAIVINNKDISNSIYITSNEKAFALAAIDTTLKGGLEMSLEEAKAKYSDYKIWSFENMQPGEERNIFNTFETTPEMIKDTSAIVTIRGIYIPDENLEEHKIVEKEMEIVTSHDPNKMAVYNRLINYRLVRFQKMKYKIKFQNNGEGPATTIKLVTETPQMLENSSLEVLDMYPKCPICPKQEVRYSCLDTLIAKDSIIFTFKNIYLPGTAQKNVMNKDSTKGFVKYRLDFSKDFHKITQRSKTAIIFDKNLPIITNTSVARFKPGISIGTKASYNYYLNNAKEEYDWDLGAISFDKKDYTLTATLSPYKSYKKYWQIELGISQSTGSAVIETENGLSDIPLDNGTVALDSYFHTRHSLESAKTNIVLVPFSYRYNFNAIFGAGAGIQTTFSLSNKVSDYSKSVYYRSTAAGLIGEEITNLAVTPNTIETVYNNGFSLYNYGLFIDITAGASRIGPSGGLRYVSNFKQAEQYLQFYAIWKF